MSPVTLLPDVDYDVVLRGQLGGSYPGRIVELRPPYFVLERTGDPHPDLPGEVGDRLLVTWPDDRGLVCLPVLLTDQQSDAPVRWTVEVVGDGWREQRRHFPRAVIEGTSVTRYATSDGTVATAYGHLIDASEAGVRCAVESKHAALSTPGTRVEVDLMLGDDFFELRGQVLYGKRDTREDDRVEVVIVFDRPVPRSDEIRGHIERQRHVGRGRVRPLDDGPALRRRGSDR